MTPQESTVLNDPVSKIRQTVLSENRDSLDDQGSGDFDDGGSFDDSGDDSNVV